ncbi:MAG: polyprenyl synthetase family protein, partial [Bacteroides sp.]
MSILYNLKKSIHNELSYFDFFLKKTVKSSIPLINNINKYLHNNKGKQIRPIFVFLSALLTGKITDKTYRSAVLIEMLHIATLMHDDVIDNSYERRGNFSVNALWNNRTSILFGDYIFSKIISLLVENKDFDILSILMNLINNMSEGEILQSEKSRMLDMNKKIYFTIINNKTASFIKTCCSIGLISSNININNNNVKNIELFGQYIGIAFQI